METIGRQTLWSFSESGTIKAMKCDEVRASEAFQVSSFQALARRVAELQFRNRDFNLLFRGQTSDYRNKVGRTTIRPSLIRPNDPRMSPKAETVERRFGALASREAALMKAYEIQFPSPKDDIRRLQRERILRWSILQHYEVCRTPLLDVTSSLRIAASFASVDEPERAFVFVLGLPNLSGAITASVEAGLQVVRLASVCPPAAVRPHIQEGYLLGEYPEVATVDQRSLYSDYEMDFGRRLVAKFSFSPAGFWRRSDNFPRIPPTALYPIADLMKEIARGESPKRATFTRRKVL